MAGVPVKTVQSVMRHSSITLTMDTYGHLFPGQEADAVTKMRDMMATDQPDRMRATGTDDVTILEDDGEQRASHMQRAGRDTQRTGATSCDELAQPAILKITEKPGETRAGCDPVPSGTMPCTHLAPLAQSAEQLTLNQ